MSDSVATLSTMGWVDDPYYKADNEMSYFFSSDASQSTIFAGRVASLPNLIKVHGHDSIRLESAIKEALHTLLLPYFDEVIVDVRVTVAETENSIDEDIRVDCLAVEAGKSYPLSKLVSVVDSKLQRVINLQT